VLRGSGFLQQYVGPISAGVLAFVVLSFVLLIPYAIIQYRRRGRVGARRTLVESLFLLYLLCAWALVLLPLPDITGEFCTVRHVTAQTTAFQWVHDTWREWQRAGGEPLDLIRSKSLWIRVFNVALLVPFGVFLRRWWRRGFWLTALSGLLLSLAFELTQLTGVWGLYPCAYRTFDVDDLMANTVGACLGWIIAPLIVLLPARRTADDARPRVERPTVPRRIVADVVDLALLLLTAIPLSMLLRRFSWGSTISAAVMLVIIVVLIPIALRGRTPGKALVRLRITSRGGGRAAWWRVSLRGVVLWLPLIAPVWVLDAIDVDDLRESTAVLALFVILLVMPWAWALAVLVTVVARDDDRGPHDLAAGTAQDVS
jgi:ADP-dependent NAD(P)H-hydrate dehydratase / NAD(P)H-hydrate epimerase